MNTTPTPAPAQEIFAGLMSGTSLDAADAAIVSFDTTGRPQLLGSASIPYPQTLRDELLALHVPGFDELHRAAQLANLLADLYAEALLQACVAAAITPADVVAAGVHGQTLRHRPESGYTLQLNQPARIAEQSGITIVADFRSRDIAAGGQGAPLVPAFHASLFSSALPRAVLNIGGIANLTLLNNSDDVTGFDTGPGNMLLDHWAQQHLHLPFDRDGAWAASGKVDSGLLNALLSEPYFSLPAPKSTGRDLFNPTWLQLRLREHASLPPADVQATLLALTANSIGNALQQAQPETHEVIVCGGGAYNAELLRLLRVTLPHVRWQTSDAQGVAPEWIEAMAFAWLAQQCLQGLPGNLPSVTGAQGSRILGAIYQK
ncbi:MAG: anhydro-N-acetylmuramic acid kinase [Burkholderiaceae bacterium]|nr:MAG: anhydro-N-acetylmuramic acid kinase [Burkholderiaceae bacterium]